MADTSTYLKKKHGSSMVWPTDGFKPLSFSEFVYEIEFKNRELFGEGKTSCANLYTSANQIINMC